MHVSSQFHRAMALCVGFGLASCCFFSLPECGKGTPPSGGVHCPRGCRVAPPPPATPGSAPPSYTSQQAPWSSDSSTQQEHQLFFYIWSGPLINTCGESADLDLDSDQVS